MGFMSTIRDALALPALAARGGDLSSVPVESPWASPNHLIGIDPPRDRPLAVDRKLAMSVPAIARARRLIVGSIARCPLEARTDGTRAEAQPIWMVRTDSDQSPTFRMSWTIDDLLFHGWSLWGLERDRDNRVIRADRVPYSMWSTDSEDRITINDKPVDPSEVCLIPGPDEGLLATAGSTIRHAVELQRLAQRNIDTPAAQVDLHQTSGSPLTKEQIETLIESWVTARRGKNGGVAYTNQTIEARELGKVDPQMMIEARNAAALDVARACGVPASMVDAAPAGTGNVTYRNQDARNTELIDYCLAPFMASIAARLGLDDMVPRGWAVAFDLTDLTSTTVGDLDVPDDDQQDDDETDTEGNTNG